MKIRMILWAITALAITKAGAVIVEYNHNAMIHEKQTIEYAGIDVDQ